MAGARLAIIESFGVISIFKIRALVNNINVMRLKVKFLIFKLEVFHRFVNAVTHVRLLPERVQKVRFSHLVLVQNRTR